MNYLANQPGIPLTQLLKTDALIAVQLGQISYTNFTTFEKRKLALHLARWQMYLLDFKLIGMGWTSHDLYFTGDHVCWLSYLYFPQNDYRTFKLVKCKTRESSYTMFLCLDKLLLEIKTGSSVTGLLQPIEGTDGLVDELGKIIMSSEGNLVPLLLRLSTNV